MFNQVICRNTVSPVIKGAGKDPDKATAEDGDEAKKFSPKSQTDKDILSKRTLLQ